MTEHANLYFLFLEDREANPIRTEKDQEIRKNIKKFFNAKNAISKSKTEFICDKSFKQVFWYEFTFVTI